MGKWIGWKTAVGRCNRMPKDFKRIFLEEVKSMDDRNIIRIIKIQRNGRNGHIEVSFELYTEGENIRENLPYSDNVFISSMNKTKERLGI